MPTNTCTCINTNAHSHNSYTCTLTHTLTYTHILSSPVLFVPLSTDLCGPCQLLQRHRLLPISGLRLSFPLPYSGHAALSAVQCGPVDRQSSRQVRVYKGPGRPLNCHGHRLSECQFIWYPVMALPLPRPLQSCSQDTNGQSSLPTVPSTRWSACRPSRCSVKAQEPSAAPCSSFPLQSLP